jgi:hypothetical protein
MSVRLANRRSALHSTVVELTRPADHASEANLRSTPGPVQHPLLPRCRASIRHGSILRLADGWRRRNAVSHGRAREGCSSVSSSPSVWRAADTTWCSSSSCCSTSTHLHSTSIYYMALLLLSRKSLHTLIRTPSLTLIEGGVASIGDASAGRRRYCDTRACSAC